jgi:hypothetical protein
MLHPRDRPARRCTDPDDNPLAGKAAIVGIRANALSDPVVHDLPAPEAEHARWIKPLSCYERRETTIVEGLRYG